MPELLPLESLPKTKRLNILTPTEIDDLYARPQLTEEQRINLFELDRDEQKILVSKLSMSSKIDAIIRLGYFKLKQKFFQFDLQEVSEDVKHVMERYFSSTALDKYTISHVTRSNNQRWGYALQDSSSLVRLKMHQYCLTKLKNYVDYQLIQYLFFVNY